MAVFFFRPAATIFSYCSSSQGAIVGHRRAEDSSRRPREVAENGFGWSAGATLGAPNPGQQVSGGSSNAVVPERIGVHNASVTPQLLLHRCASGKQGRLKPRSRAGRWLRKCTDLICLARRLRMHSRKL